MRLQQLLRWLTANGAKGFGDPDDPNTKVGVFLQDTNNRGLIATKDVKAGQVIFQVPVALGVVDDAEGDECPWSVRLAAKVLRLEAEGDACLWSEYINVLPDRVSNPTSPDVAFEQVVAIGDEVARSEVDFSRWIASSNFKRLLCRSSIIQACSMTAYILKQLVFRQHPPTPQISIKLACNMTVP